MYGTGIEFICEVDAVWAFNLGIPFRGSCEIEIDKVTCWIGKKYSNSFKVELVAKNVKVDKLLMLRASMKKCFQCNKFYTTIKMLKYKDLETYLIVKDYIEDKGVMAEEIIESMDCEKIPIKVSHDGITEKFYSLVFAARYMGVSLANLHYNHNNKHSTIIGRKGGTKVFKIEWEM